MVAMLAALVFAQTRDLTFEPKERDVLVVSVIEEQEWDYPEENMKGKLHSELTLRWTFDKGSGKGVFERVVYRGKGHKKGSDFDHDIEWTLKDGYLKGKDSEADKQWCAKEIREGISLKFDRRGACEK